MDPVQTVRPHGGGGARGSWVLGRWGVRRSPRLLLTGTPHPPPATINPSAPGPALLRPPRRRTTDLRRHPSSGRASLRKVRSSPPPPPPHNMRTPPLLSAACGSRGAALDRTLGGSDRRAADLWIRVRRCRQDRARISRLARDLAGCGGNGATFMRACDLNSTGE